MATLSVHEFQTIKSGQHILASITVGNVQQGHKDHTNAVHAGWAVSQRNLFFTMKYFMLEVVSEF